MNGLPGRTLLAVAALALLATGCGIRPTGIIDGGARPTASATASKITVFLATRDGRIRAVERSGIARHPYLPIQQLTVRATEIERRQGLRTRVPSLLFVNQLTSPGELDIGEKPARSASADEKWSRTALAQLVCTADELTSVSSVRLHYKNRDSDVLRCQDFADLKT